MLKYTLPVMILALGVLSQASAQPPSLYGVAHIKNESVAVATTYYKWGNGPWKKVVIAKGQSMAFAYAYDGNSKVSPTLYVRIDTDTDGVKYVEHTLTRGGSPDDNDGRYGHKFVIKQLQGTDTRYIDNVTPGATVRVIDARSTKPNVQ